MLDHFAHNRKILFAIARLGRGRGKAWQEFNATFLIDGAAFEMRERNVGLAAKSKGAGQVMANARGLRIRLELMRPERDAVAPDGRLGECEWNEGDGECGERGDSQCGFESLGDFAEAERDEARNGDKR